MFCVEYTAIGAVYSAIRTIATRWRIKAASGPENGAVAHDQGGMETSMLGTFKLIDAKSGGAVNEAIHRLADRFFRASGFGHGVASPAWGMKKQTLELSAASSAPVPVTRRAMRNERWVDVDNRRIP